MTDAAGNSPLNILVCVKFVPDPNQLQADADGHPDLARAPFRISTFDENAIEAALQLGAKHGGRVFGLSVATGRRPPRDVLLRALAMGLEGLYLVIDEAGVAADPYRAAVALAAATHAIADAEAVPAWHLLLCGEASADEFNAQVGPRLAAALDLPAITHATRLAVEQGELVATRAVEERSETLQARLPAVATVGTEISQARMPTVLQVMGAGRKPLRELPIEALPGFDAAALRQRPSVQTLDVSAPPSARKRVVIEGKTAAERIGALLARLRTDGEIKV